MLNSKQRAKLKSMANNIDTIFQVGKDGVTETVISQIEQALLAREIIKIRVLENAPVLPKECAFEIGEKVKCEVVQVIGTKIVLYKPHPKEPVININ